jgi:ATP-dependent RNA helicase DHX37/DHR1
MGKNKSHPHTMPLSHLGKDVLETLGQPLTETQSEKHAGRNKKKNKQPEISNKEKKRKQRKMKKLAEKKAKLEERETIMQKIRENCLDEQKDAAVIELMNSSANLGQKDSTKIKLKKELYKEKMGLNTGSMLIQEKEVNENDMEIDSGFKEFTWKATKDWLDDKPIELPVKHIQPIKKPAQPKKKPKIEEPKLEEKEYIIEPTPELNPDRLAGYITEPLLPEVPYKFHVKVSRLPSIEETRRDLPIINLEQEIMETIQDNSFTIICGETGSGKSTQVPQFLYEAGYSHVASGLPGRIGITQPRRVAAISLAQRVAQELNVSFGREVGYQIRYDTAHISTSTQIKFMTDGILLREIESDFLLKEYSVVIIDEAHERSINTDILLGLLSRIVPLRQELADTIYPLRVIIMSATLRVTDFTENTKLFPKGIPPVINVQTRQFPVEIHFSKTTDREAYIDRAFSKAIKIHKTLPEGNILIFLTGQRDVKKLKSMLDEELAKDTVKVLTLYSMLSSKKQMKIFKEYNKRMIVVSTNVAETSLTIPNVKYVIDTGLEKKKVYSNRLQMSKYEVDWISKASAEQRSGRAGRTGPGYCYRLYSNAAYGIHFEDFKQPEIMTSPIEGTALMLKAMGIKNINKFPFPTTPIEQSMNSALDQLHILGAISPCRKGIGDIYNITDLGKRMASLPISPRYSKMLVLARESEVLLYIILLVSGLTVEQIFFNDTSSESAKERTANTKTRHTTWMNDRSDLLSIVNLLVGYFRKASKAENKEEYLAKFGDEYFINAKSLKEAISLSSQLYGLIHDLKKPDPYSIFCHINLPNSSQREIILKFLTAGFIDQVACKDDSPLDERERQLKRIPYISSCPLDSSIFPADYLEVPTNKDKLFIHPSSYLYSRDPAEFLCYSELIFTKRPYMKNLTKIKTEWLCEFGGGLISFSKPLENPPPEYDEKTQTIQCWRSPSFGKKCWRLPIYRNTYLPSEEGFSRWVTHLLSTGKLSREVAKANSWIQ